MILGGAMVVTLRNPLLRLFGFSLPWLQLAAIVFTANHYILDAFAGLLVGLAGVGLALALQRWVYPWVVRRYAASRVGLTAAPHSLHRTSPSVETLAAPSHGAE